MTKDRKHPLTAGSKVLHMDGVQAGEIVELREVNGLPGARIKWRSGGTEDLPLGYLQPVTGDAV